MVLTRLYTAEDLWNLATDEEEFELIEGVLAPMVPPDFRHGTVQANLLYALSSYAGEFSSGRAVGRAGFILQRGPDTVLAPDAAFIAEARWPEDTSRFVELAPDLAVEIISPGNSPGEIERKLAIYLHSGVRAIWVVYPDERQVVVHTPHHPPAIYSETDQIDGGDVLPGLALPVADFFA